MSWSAALLLALFGTLIVPNRIGRIASTRCAKWKCDVMVLEWACKEFAQDHAGRYPVTLSELSTTNSSGMTYIEGHRLPLDPWKRAYGYEPPSAQRLVPRIYTLGKDGQPGGEGEDEDLDDSMLFADD